MNLAETIENARLIVKTFARGIESQKLSFEKADLPRLRETVQRLSFAKMARKLICPEEYRQMWFDFLARKIEKLPPRAVRYLCWETDIATDKLFLQYLRNSDNVISARSLQGLVYSQHRRWSAEISDNLEKLREFVTDYEGRNHLLNKWRESLHLVLQADSPTNCCRKMYYDKILPEIFFQESGINEQTNFAAEIMNKFAFALPHIFHRDTAASTLFLENILTWKHFEISVFKKIIEKVLLHDFFKENENFREKLTEFILRDSRLGDPRLPKNTTQWMTISPEAKNLFIQTLAREDIIFFFEEVMTANKHQGRKDFWLQYVHLLKQSRPLLNKRDKARLQFQMNKNNRNLHFGEITGQYSAFILDFGSVLVVEFDGVGSIYFYDEAAGKRLFPNIYKNNPFRESELKKFYEASERISHTPSWTYHARNVLARFGVR